MDQIGIFFQEISNWVSSLDLADLLGVIGFLLSALMILISIVRILIRSFRREKSVLQFHTRIEDVTHQIFKKKGFVTFDLYIRNENHIPVEILRTGFVLSDGTEKTLYEEDHKLKRPDISIIEPGREAFYNDCDLFYTLNDQGVCYKKIMGIFIDIKDKPRFVSKVDIHPFLNDLTIRGILTDKKGLNGF